MNIVPYKVKSNRSARRGSKAIQAGQKVYLIEARGKYFHFSYLRERDALTVQGRLMQDKGDEDIMFEFNFTVDPECCLHVEKL